MSDAAISSIVAGVLTLATMVIGFLTLWLKVKYGVDRVNAVEGKIDHNTNLTTQAADAAAKASEHALTCDEERAKLLRVLNDHDTRIAALEAQIGAIRTSVDAVSRNIDSTRHEMRGHLQTLTSKLDILTLTVPRAESSKT